MRTRGPEQSSTRRTAAFHLYLQGHTYNEIGLRLGISRQRVQQMVRPPKPLYKAIQERAYNKCEKCGIFLKKGVGHVHHIKRLGMELDTINGNGNLQYLCGGCHRTAHKKFKLPCLKFKLVRVKKLKTCKKHQNRVPCKLCVAYRASRGGSVSSARKTKANRKKALRAILKRWHPELSTVSD